MTDTKRTSDTIKSRAELARLVGRNPSQITRWLSRDDWPFSKSGPWPRSELAAMLRWAADALDRSKETTDDEGGEEGSLAGLKKQKLEQQVRKLRISADNEEMRNLRQRASVIDRHLIEPALMKLADVLRNTGDALTRRFGNDAAEILIGGLDDFEKGLEHLFETLGSNSEQSDNGTDEAIPVASSPAKTPNA